MREGKIPEYMVKKALAGIDESDNKEMPEFGAASAQLVLYAPEDAALAVHRAMNRLYEQGKRPFGLIITALLPQKISERAIKCLMRSIAAAAGAHSARIIDRNYSVSGAVEHIVVSVTACGSDAGEVHNDDSGMNAGKELRGTADALRYLIQTRFAGMVGSLLLARERRSELKARYTDEFLDGCEVFAQNLSIREDAQIAAELGAERMLEAYEGGIFGALWELSEACGSGMEIWLPEIMFRQETIEICEYFDASPYQLLAGGSALIVTTRPQELVEAFAKRQIPAAVIGKLTDGNDRIVCNHGEIRYLEPVRQDEYTKIRKEATIC